jgi:YHS domain-containing protein
MKIRLNMPEATMAITVIITITKKLNPACLKAYEVGSLLAGFNFIYMESLNKECVVTGKEVVDPQNAPKSTVNGHKWAFCTSTCKKYFDLYLVKFAEKRFPPPKKSLTANSTSLHLKQKH